MSDYLKDEAKVGAMLRHMSGDVGLAMKKVLEELYDGTPIGVVCAKWHWRLVKYSPDPVLVRKYISIIEFAYEYNINLEEMRSWKKTMRIILPEEFMYKMGKYTQVPNIAIMDENHEFRKERLRDFRDAPW